MVLYLVDMFQWGLHAVLWSHIGTPMHRLAAEPRSTPGLLFSFRCLSGTILLTLYSMVWDWRVSRAGQIFFYWPKLLYPYYSLLLFSLSLLSVYWLDCGDGVFRLIGCISLSLNLALPTFFNNNNNNAWCGCTGFLVWRRRSSFRTPEAQPQNTASLSKIGALMQSQSHNFQWNDAVNFVLTWLYTSPS